jgi:CO/xanthine dehydrogenase Mo-binding subunit
MDPAFPWYYTDRYLGVMSAVAEAANWQPRLAASNLSNATVVTGRGISAVPHAGTTAAVVAEIEVNKKTGKIVVKHLYISQDAGLTVSPANANDQMIGGAIQATSRALHEQVNFDTGRVTSSDWVTYPILRFKDAPKVTPIVVQRPDKLAGGAGEVPMPSVVGAIANAFFDATGVRIRVAPMTPPRVRGVLDAAGVT